MIASADRVLALFFAKQFLGTMTGEGKSIGISYHPFIEWTHLEDAEKRKSPPKGYNAKDIELGNASNILPSDSQLESRPMTLNDRLESTHHIAAAQSMDSRD